jgi:hypothetical protein
MRRSRKLSFYAFLMVHNLEAAAVTLNSMACVPVSGDRSVVPPAPQFTAMQVPMVVAANSASAVGVYVSLSQLRVSPAAVSGFPAYYSGSMPSGTETPVPVRFSYTFRISLADARRTGLALPALVFPVIWPVQFNPASWDLSGALSAVSGFVMQPSAAVSKAGGQIIDPATKTVAIALSANPHDLGTQAQAQAAIKAGLTGIALKSGGSLRQAPMRAC